jgi:MerR family transcriptional regulator, thiopeptide resistance regulator
MDEVLLAINEVARASGVSSRTLRHYDAIGLLRPAQVGRNGYRFYSERELARLQRILLLRELGLGLYEIRSIVDDDSDPLEALRRHRVDLLRRRQELEALLTTVDTTIESWKNGETMPTDDLFAGFDPRRQAAYEEELVDRFGDDVAEPVAQSRASTAGWTPRDFADVQEAFAAIDQRLAQLIEQGAAPRDPAVQVVIAEHYAVVARFWTPNAERYAGLGRLYVDHADFRARYDAVHPQLAEFLRDAMAVYSEEVL